MTKLGTEWKYFTGSEKIVIKIGMIEIFLLVK